MNNNSIDNENNYISIRCCIQNDFQQLFILNTQKSLTNRRHSQIPSYIDE